MPPAKKKSPAKKAPVKKTIAKKSPAKKAPAKKAPAKKSPAKKAPPKKSPAKKTAAKKAAPAKAKKDPSAPKRGLSAFMFFSQEQRPAVLKANPNIAFGEVGKKLGEAWAKCKDKSKYEAKAAADKKRYDAAMAKYSKKK